jgi:hypothetical protein
MNPSLGAYHVPVNSDIGEMVVELVTVYDNVANEIGTKLVGEIGICGAARRDRKCDLSRDRSAHPGSPHQVTGFNLTTSRRRTRSRPPKSAIRRADLTGT